MLNLIHIAKRLFPSFALLFIVLMICLHPIKRNLNSAVSSIVTSQHFMGSNLKTFAIQDYNYNNNNIITENLFRLDVQRIKDTFGQEILNHALQPPKRFQPFPNGYNSPIVDNETQLMFCWIPKVACTRFKGFFCRKKTPKARKKIMESLQKFNPVTIHLSKHCSKAIGPTSKSAKDEQIEYLSSNDWKKWAVIREPFDRILSAWNNKCGMGAKHSVRIRRCYSCDTNFECFIRRNSDYMKRISNEYSGTYGNNHSQYDHFYPQYWYCDFKRHLQDYRLFYYDKSDEFKQNIRDALLEIDMPAEIVTSGWGDEGNQPFLSSTNAIVQDGNDTERSTAQEFLQTRLDLADMIFRTYLVDYLAFSFKLPSWVGQLCGSTDAQPGSIVKQYLVCDWLLLLS